MLLGQVQELLAGHRWCFGQERTYRRVVALVLAEIFAFGRHTVTQLLLTVGLAYVCWLRQQLDAVGRECQRVLYLADGSYEKADLWVGLPARVIAAFAHGEESCPLCLPAAE